MTFCTGHRILLFRCHHSLTLVHTLALLWCWKGPLATHTQQFSVHRSIYGNGSWDAMATYQRAASSGPSDEGDHLIFVCGWRCCCNVGEWTKDPQRKKNGLEFKMSSSLKLAICGVLIFKAGVTPSALALMGQYQVAGVKNRISSIPRGACFWREASIIRTLNGCRRAARKPTLGRLVCDGP